MWKGKTTEIAILASKNGANAESIIAPALVSFPASSLFSATRSPRTLPPSGEREWDVFGRRQRHSLLPFNNKRLGPRHVQVLIPGFAQFAFSVLFTHSQRWVNL